MMRKLIKVCRYGKLIGFLGIPGLIWDMPGFRFFWLFWLLGLVEIFSNFPIFMQSVKMLIGMLVVPVRYGEGLPDQAHTGSSVKFSLPFSGSWVVVNGGVEKASSHSWEIPTQRYAYDFLVLDAGGKSFSGEQTSADAYYCYGKDILAPADGVVVEVLDGQPDSAIDEKGSVDCAAKDIRGNYIVIRHDESTFSVLAHLKSGSLRVNKGESVGRGQPIAQCGNSGNSSEPHLHVQIQNGESFYFSAGVPICFEGISAKPFAGYDSYDPRPIQVFSTQAHYITRGQLVWNEPQ